MLKDLVMKSRSYRGFDESRRVTKEELTEFVDTARFCPSSVNKQPLKYRLVYEEKEVEKLLSLTGWAKALKDMKLPHDGMHPTAFIVICQDLSIDETPNKYQKDVGITAQTMLLAAAEIGLGGCMIGTYGREPVKELLHLAEEIAPMLVVTFGKPSENVILTEIEDGQSTAYYRDKDDKHFVPKRRLKDIIL